MNFKKYLVFFFMALLLGLLAGCGGGDEPQPEPPVPSSNQEEIQQPEGDPATGQQPEPLPPVPEESPTPVNIPGLLRQDQGALMGGKLVRQEPIDPDTLEEEYELPDFQVTIQYFVDVPVIVDIITQAEYQFFKEPPDEVGQLLEDLGFPKLTLLHSTPDQRNFSYTDEDTGYKYEVQVYSQDGAAVDSGAGSIVDRVYVKAVE